MEYAAKAVTRLVAFCVVLACSVAGAQQRATVPFDSAAPLNAHGTIDVLVFQHLKQLGIQPAALCSDSVFVRRVYLDTIGTLPTAQETAQFLADRAPEKRSVLIDRLLDREEFSDYQAMKWSDLLRVKAEFPINLWPNAAQTYHHWIRTSIHDNKPYDQFVREMLTASGSNFRVPPVNWYRAMQSREPQGIAQTVALTFMGARADAWPKNRLADMAVFFSQLGYKQTNEWKEEIVFFDPSKGAASGAVAGQSAARAYREATFPDGTHARLAPDQDPRQVFAEWLTAPENPWFARNIVNRVWCWMLGRGIVHEPDDMRPGNPPENPELLAWLERELVTSHYDIKRIYRLILNSQSYQLSSIPRTDRADAAMHFAYYPLRRLDAEVLLDALNQITGTGESYSSAIPEPYTFMPDDQRAISLPDGSISSSFLELFGRPSRDTGFESERNNSISGAQRLHMLNSTHIQKKLEQSPKLQRLIRNTKDPQDLVTKLYLTILSRYPTAEETRVIATHSQAGRSREAVMDLAWALINSAEFLYRH